MNDGVFPDYRADKKGDFAIEQEKNSFYVAVTRAKRLLYITYPQSTVTRFGSNRIQKKSRFLENL
jgi:DNA helicase-2/ATP-dependent DNA helicase PcrA